MTVSSVAAVRGSLFNDKTYYKKTLIAPVRYDFIRQYQKY
jgi:hypothetical protein